MSVVSKEYEIQENLIVLIEDLQNCIYDFKHRIADYSQLYNKTRNQTSQPDEQSEKLVDRIGEEHSFLFYKVELLDYLFEIISDYRDGNGLFQNPIDMFDQVKQIMLEHAEKEHYELAATVKKWYDRLADAIYIK